MKKIIVLIVLIPFLMACEQKKDSFIEVNGKTYIGGSDYVVLEKPIQFGDSPLTSVIEVFWYGCPHCEDFEPLLQDWIKTLPKGLLFGRSPAIWSKAMVVHAQAYYMAQKLQFDQEFHMRLFTRILSLRSSKDLDYHKARIASLFAEKGINRQQFDELFASEEIMKAVAASEHVMKLAGIQSTPSFLVSGKYVLTANAFKNRQELLAVATHMVKREMAAQPADWW